MQANSSAQALPASATLDLADRAKVLKAAGHPVISMAVGEPDFNAPRAAREAAARAIESGQVRYTPAAGLASLRQAIAEHVSTTRQIPVEPGEIVVGHSCKHMLSLAFETMLNAGDEVLLFTPAWNSYEAQMRWAGGQPVWVPCQPDLRPDWMAIEAALGPKTRAIILNSPSNPSGYVWTLEEITRLAQLVVHHDLFVVTDEIYQRLLFDNARFHSILAVSPEVRARTLLVDGASKNFAMTGYRIGFALAPKPIAAALTRVISQTTGCANYVSQMAYQAVLVEEPPEVADMLQAFQTRRDFFVPGLQALGLDLLTPGGAFYAFPNVARHLRGRSVETFCAELLEQHHVATVPGTVFGAPQHIRLSYALFIEDLEEALRRIARFVETP